MASMANVCARICLAEAQALTAARAHVRGGSLALASQLFVGASDLFDSASKTLRASTSEHTYVPLRSHA